jgi:hypothetical protein
MLSSLFSAIKGSVKSNPVTIQMSSVPSSRVEIVLQFSQPLNQSELEPNVPEFVDYFCHKGEVSFLNHTCSDGQIVSLQCNGSALSLHSQCPFTIYSPVCNSLLGSSVTEGVCFEVAHTDTNVTCSCPVAYSADSRRLAVGNTTEGYSVSYVGMLSAVRKSFLTTIGTADNLDADTLKSGWSVIVVVGTFAAAIMVALLSSNAADEREKSRGKKGMEEVKRAMAGNLARGKKVRPAAKKVRHTATRNKDLAMIENSLPSVLSSLSLSQKIVNEVKHHHRWLGVVFFYSESFPRVLRVVSLATNIIIMLFIQSITYTLTNPDDGSCEALYTRATCIEPRSSFATGESKCSWDGSDCEFVQPSGSAKIILFVAIFSAIISTPIALSSDWIVQHVLSATTATKKSTVSVGSDGSMKLDNARVTRRTNVNTAVSSVFKAQAELRVMSSELFKYREDLSETQRIEFDGTCIV